MISRAQIESVVNQIVDLFHPDKVILFGSYAYGEPSLHSDADLLVIFNYEGRAFQKSLEILRAIEYDFPLDLLVRRPEEAEKRYREFCPFMRSAFNHGEVLYERDIQELAS